MKQLQELARRFPDNQIQKKPGKSKAAYVTHSVVNERLLYAVGAFDFELVQIIRGYAPAIHDRDSGELKYEARTDAVVGVVARLTLTIDGVQHSVEEVGDEENPAMQGDGANLKNAMSDALKRAAMRFGLGLHLWSQEKYFLDRALSQAQEGDSKPQRPAKAKGGGKAPKKESKAAEAPTQRDMELDDIPPEDDVFPPEKKETPQVRTLSEKKAKGLDEGLRKLGIDDPLALAQQVTGLENIESLMDLNTKEASRVWEVANGGSPEESEAAA